MEKTILLNIAVKINDIAKSDGVYAKVEFNPDNSTSIDCWDIELTYNNFHIIERFNSIMPIDDFETDRIAGYLLAGLFNSYFSAKLESKR